MFCKNCGQQLNEGAVFCGNCGTKITGSRVNQNENKISGQVQQGAVAMHAKTKKSGKKARKILLAVIVVILLAGGGTGVALLFVNTQNADFSKEVSEQWEKEEIEETESERNMMAEEVQEADNEQDTMQLPAEDKEDSEDAYTLFGITKGTVENYASALNTNDYKYYNSGIANFRFFYPAELYGDVVYNEQETEGLYGTNVKTVVFAGTAGSELLFSLSRYEEGAAIEKVSEKIYNTEKAELLDASDVVYATYEDHGRIIVTGYTTDGSKLVYNLFHVDSEYVMQMKIIFPTYQGMGDKLQKDYVTECLYRLCGFSGSTANCRSYDAYKTESMNLEAEIAQIKEQYYSVQESLNDMETAEMNEVTVYMEEGNIHKIVVNKGTWEIDYAREYFFMDGRLYFVFLYDGRSERRFYFVDDMLVRYIDEISEIYDLEDADFYMQFVSEYQNEAYRLFSEM